MAAYMLSSWRFGSTRSTSNEESSPQNPQQARAGVWLCVGVQHAALKSRPHRLLVRTTCSRRLSDMFEQLAPFGGNIFQPTACSRFGITGSITEECWRARFVESDAGT